GRLANENSEGDFENRHAGQNPGFLLAPGLDKLALLKHIAGGHLSEPEARLDQLERPLGSPDLVFEKMLLSDLFLQFVPEGRDLGGKRDRRGLEIFGGRLKLESFGITQRPDSSPEVDFILG